jgi:hypothetical protein
VHGENRSACSSSRTQQGAKNETQPQLARRHRKLNGLTDTSKYVTLGDTATGLNFFSDETVKLVVKLTLRVGMTVVLPMDVDFDGEPTES